MPRTSNEKKQQVLHHIYDTREIRDPVVKKYNLPIWVGDKRAAQSLVREGILEDDPHNDDGDCYRAGLKFEQGLRKYGVVSKPVV